MTERDVFESRLRSALLRHVADGPTDFDALGFARAVAAKEPRRRGLPAALAWRGVVVPRVAWVLLLLAALLTAMVAGMLIVGSQPERKLPVVVPPVGQVFACPSGSNPDVPGPVGQARPGSSETVAFDRRAGRLVAVLTAGTGVETWTFDVCTNTWTQMHPNREPRTFGWARLVYDVDSDATIGVFAGKVWAYDLQANTWTEKRVAPTDATRWAYDPASGLLVAASADPVELWNYDVETDTWTPIHQANGPAYGAEFAYDASVDRMVAYTGGPQGRPQTWLFDIRTGTWSRSGVETPQVVAGWGLPATIDYDEAAERTVVLSNAAWAAYDAAADRWEILVAAEPGWLPSTMVYDPVNERLVGPGPAWNQGALVEDRAGVVAFDLVTREWTVLLEPSDGQPAPSSE